MIRPLEQTYVCRLGAPSLSQVDTTIFTTRYFTFCMQCTFCHDSCCSYGVDVDIENVGRLLKAADAFEAFLGVPRDEWFEPGWIEDAEFPGGRYTRIQVRDGRCVFLNRAGRGCQIHRYCESRALNYHELKPLVSVLYPVTFDEALLQPSDEVGEHDLICLGQGPTLYRGTRDQLAWYFGRELVAALDEIERETRTAASGM